MIFYTDEFIDRLIKEDVPYIDLTTQLIGIEQEKGCIEYRVREDSVVACTEEASRILMKLGIEIIVLVPSGTVVKKGAVILSGKGNAGKLHMSWKVCLNILEYCCGVATHAKEFVDKAKNVSPDISVLFTRKSFPGTKELVVKAALSGGVFPHRLGISETILVFKQHLNFLGGFDGFIPWIPSIRSKSCEHRIIVEVEKLEDAIKLVTAGVDGIQFDKVPAQTLKNYVDTIREINDAIVLIAAGGVTIQNAEQYAASGVNALVTSSFFHGKPLDIQASIIADS